MVVHYITSAEHVLGKEINLPRDESGLRRMYEVDGGKVSFSYYNSGYQPGVGKFDIPDGARTVEFSRIEKEIFLGPGQKETIQVGGKTGLPIYRDKRGNVLKIGNH